jgi:hypothetical protein
MSRSMNLHSRSNNSTKALSSFDQRGEATSRAVNIWMGGRRRNRVSLQLNNII